MSDITKRVASAIQDALTQNDAELVDIEFAKKHGSDNLTVFIYTDGGVTLDFCEKIHNTIDPILEELDPTNGQPYVLNVSSPGLDRPLKTQRDFERNYGQGVEVKLYAPLRGIKLFEGELLHHDENTTTLTTTDKKTHEQTEQKIENTRIACVKPLVKFE